MNAQEIMGDKAIGLLRTIHERNMLGDSQIARDVADLLGRPGDPEAEKIRLITNKWIERGNQDRRWLVLARAVRTESDRLAEIANARGAGRAAARAVEDLKLLIDVCENSL